MPGPEHSQQTATEEMAHIHITPEVLHPSLTRGRAEHHVRLCAAGHGGNHVHLQENKNERESAEQCMR